MSSMIQLCIRAPLDRRNHLLKQLTTRITFNRNLIMALIGYGRFVHFYLSDQGYNLNLLNCELTKVVFLAENDFQIVLIHILCQGFCTW